MSNSSDLHLLLQDYERMFGEQDEEARREFAVAYSKDRLPHQVRQRFPCDDEFVGRMPRAEARVTALLRGPLRFRATHRSLRSRPSYRFRNPPTTNHMTEAQYSIIADRMIEEHRKYGDKLRAGHWAEVAARKVVSHIADFRGGQRLFTESEVRGIAMRAISMMSSASKNTLHVGQAAGYVGKACAEAGIKLDPTP
jgi:hypothetical protein